MKNLNPQNKYIIKLYSYRAFIILSRVMLFLGFLSLWEYSANTGKINAFIFSSPSRIYRTFLDLSKDNIIYKHIFVTLKETLISFLAIILIGLILAIVLWCFKALSDMLEPFLVILNSLPKSALAPMLIVWLGANQKSIIVTAVSVALFGFTINLYTGFREIDSDMIKLIKTLGGNRWHLLKKLILPGSKEIILGNLKVNIGLCLVGVIIGEFLAAKEGLGYLIIYGSQVFKMNYVLLGIVILCIISTLMFFITSLLSFIIRKCF